MEALAGAQQTVNLTPRFESATEQASRKQRPTCKELRINLITDWLIKNLDPTKVAYRHRGLDCYLGKHVAEVDLDLYVPHEDFVAAAKSLGWPIRQTYHGRTRIGVTRRSVRRTMERIRREREAAGTGVCFA